MGKFHPLLIHQRLSLYDGFGHIEQPIVTIFCGIVMTNVDELWFWGAWRRLDGAPVLQRPEAVLMNDWGNG
jgi:hypothetical protein